MEKILQGHAACEEISVRPVLVSAGTWDARTETVIRNTGKAPARLTLRTRMTDEKDVVFGQAHTEVETASGESVRVEQSVLAYGINEGTVYIMVSDLYDGEALADEKRTGFVFER